MEKERRFFKVKEYRIKKNEDGQNVLEGYSAVFDSPSDDMGWDGFEMREYISPGAFTNALKNSDCRALFNHDPNFVLGRESAGTLTLKQDERGLKSIITLPDTTVGRDLAISVGRGDIKEQSFAFTVSREQWEEDQENKTATRTILEFKDLFDISPVTYPAYPDTDIAKRSFEKYRSKATANRGEDQEDLATQAQENDDFDKFQDQTLINECEELLK